MDFLISDAFAQQGQPPAQGAPWEAWLFPILLFVVFYFLLIRPQQRRAKEHRKMVEALAKGDEVVTNGGLLGRITKVEDHFISLELADGLEVRVQRQAVASLMPKGTMKAS